MEWTLENMTFVVIMACAACGALMALTSAVCEVLKMTPWYIRKYEKMTVEKALNIFKENSIQHVCPKCGAQSQYALYIEDPCGCSSHKITDEEKKEV